MTFYDSWLRHVNRRVATRIRMAIRITDVFFGALSMFLFIGLVIVVALWITQKPSFQLSEVPSESVVAATGESAYIGKSLSFETDTNKAYYQMWLEDTNGNKVYQYPAVLLSDPKSISFGGRQINIPASILPGQYKLMVYVKYELNPLKTAETTLEVAQVRVYVNPADRRF